MNWCRHLSYVEMISSLRLGHGTGHGPHPMLFVPSSSPTPLLHVWVSLELLVLFQKAEIWTEPIRYTGISYLVTIHRVL